MDFRLGPWYIAAVINIFCEATMTRPRTNPVATRVPDDVFAALQAVAESRGLALGTIVRDFLTRSHRDGTLTRYFTTPTADPTPAQAPATPATPPRPVLTEEELDNLFGEPDEVIITPGYEHIVAQWEAEATKAHPHANTPTPTPPPAPIVEYDTTYVPHTPTTYDTARVVPIRAEPMPAAGSPAWVAMAQRNGVPQDTIDEHVAEYAAQQAAAQAQDVAYREHVIADIVPTATTPTTSAATQPTKPGHDLDDLFGPAST